MRIGGHALGAAKAGEGCPHHGDVFHGFLHLVDRGEIAQHPEAEVLRRQRTRRILLRDLRILRITGEVEETDGEALIVQSVDNRDGAEGIGAHNAVARLVGQPLTSIRQLAAELLSRRNDDDGGFEGKAELERAPANRGTVLRLEADARAGEDGGGREGKRCGKDVGRGAADHGGHSPQGTVRRTMHAPHERPVKRTPQIR